MGVMQKIFSGRYFSTVTIVTTYCFLMIGALWLVMVERIAVEVFLGMFAAFAAQSRDIVRSYFERTDRQGEPGAK